VCRALDGGLSLSSLELRFSVADNEESGKARPGSGAFNRAETTRLALGL